jgi:hypothetical protein
MEQQSEEGEEVEDRLSKLPDDVLLEHILNHVDLPTGVRMSALSRRWRHVPRLLSTVLLDAYDFTPPDATSDTLDEGQAMTGYSAAIRWLLADARHPAIIKRLHLAFYLEDPYLQSIGQAVQEVVETGCSVVDLRFSILTVTESFPSDGEAVWYGQHFMYFFDAYPTAFRCLTSLTLENHSLSESDIATLLSAGGRLRVLCLSDCGSGPTFSLTIDAPNSSLMTLELQSCRYRRVELSHLPKLEQLLCEDWNFDNRPPVHFGNVPRLHTVSLASARRDGRQPFSLSDWLTNATNLSVMRLNFRDRDVSRFLLPFCI